MNSPTIALALGNSNVADCILPAIRKAANGAEVVLLDDGLAVLDFFLDKRKNQRRLISPRRGKSTKCDLLLMDLALAKLDGLCVLRQLRWLHRADVSELSPVIILSDRADSDLVSAAFRYGANGFLCSTENTAQFCDRLQQTVRYWLGTTLRPKTKRRPRYSHAQACDSNRLVSQELSTT